MLPPLQAREHAAEHTRSPALPRGLPVLPQGTLFVLQKEVSAKARLLEALAARRRDDDLIEALAAEVQVRRCWWWERPPDWA